MVGFGNWSVTHDPVIKSPKPGTPMQDVVQELWDFYQCMMQDDEMRKRFEHYQTYKVLKNYDGKR